MSTGKPVTRITEQDTRYEANVFKRLLKCYFEGTNPAPHDRPLLSAFINAVVTCIRSPQAGQVPIKFDPLKVVCYAITKAEDNPLPLLATDGLLDTGNDVRIQFAHHGEPVFDRARQSRLPMLVACQAEDGAVILYWGYDHRLAPAVTCALKHILALPVRALVQKTGAQRQRLDTEQPCSFCQGRGKPFECHFGAQVALNVWLCLPCLYKVKVCHDYNSSLTSPLAYISGIAVGISAHTHTLVPTSGSDVTLTPMNSTTPPLNKGRSPIPSLEVISAVSTMIDAPGNLVWIFAHLSEECKGQLRCIWSTIAEKRMSLYDTMKEALMFLVFNHFDHFIECLVLPLNEETDTGSVLFSVFELLYQALTEACIDKKTVEHQMLHVPLFIDPRVISQILALIDGQIDACPQVVLYTDGPFKVDNNLDNYLISLCDGGIPPTNTRGFSFGFFLVDQELSLVDQPAPGQHGGPLSAGSGHTSSDGSWSSDCDEALADIAGNSQHAQMFNNARTNLSQRPDDIPPPNSTDLVDVPLSDSYNWVMREICKRTNALYDQQVTFAKVHALLRCFGLSPNLILPISDPIIDDSHLPWDAQLQGAGGEQEEGSEPSSNFSMVSEDYSHIDPDVVLSSCHRATTYKVIQLLLELGDKPTTVQDVTAFFGELQMGRIDLHTFIRHLQELVDEDDDKDSDSYKSELSANAYQPEQSDWDSDGFLVEESEEEDEEEDEDEDDEEDEEEDVEE